ncbi:MAG TPA: LysR family transcriptional regulator [Xanthobacteraceae bacterium]|nr:LysR family transcriptional regulator [Xanthobacteraceae bacterium]
MDIELARTFLEIVSTGSFVRASERLNVGQTTVSARIRLLEQQLGRKLFVRNKSGATLTPAGERFLRYAPSFVQLWQRARHQVALPPGHRAALTVGSEVTLAQPLLLDWVLWMRRSIPDVALRVHVDVPQDLISQVASGLVDAAIMYAPQNRPGLNVDLLMEEKLVLVTTRADGAAPASEYIHVDWGPEFALHHAMNLSEETPALFIDLGPLALNYILVAGGSGYFRMSAVEHHIRTGELHLVPDAPQVSHPIYVVYTGSFDDAILGPALSGLRSITAAKSSR